MMNNKKEIQNFYVRVISQVAEWLQQPYNVAREDWGKYYNQASKGVGHARMYRIVKRAWRDSSVKSYASFKNCINYIIKKGEI